MEYDTTRHDTTRHDTIRYDTIRYDTIRYDTIRYDTIFICSISSAVFPLTHKYLVISINTVICLDYDPHTLTITQYPTTCRWSPKLRQDCLTKANSLIYLI